MRRAFLLCSLLGLLSGGSLGETPRPPALTLVPEPAPSRAMQGLLRDLPRGVRAGVLVRDVETGKVLASLHADQPFIAASNTKSITGAAVLHSTQGTRGWWSTELTVPAAQSGKSEVTTLTIRGTADPTLSVSGGPNSLRELARQAYASGVRRVGAVQIDETRLSGESFARTVYELPMPAVRLSEWQNRPPRTVEAARSRLGAALIAELRRAGMTVQSDEVGTAPLYVPYKPPVLTDKNGPILSPDPVIPLARRPEQAVASVRSGSVQDFVNSTLRPSDNGQAEMLLATLAVRPYADGTLKGALQREKDILSRLGVEVANLQLEDGSGLGRQNRFSPRTLTDLMKVMYDLPYPSGQPALPKTLYRTHQNAYIEALPLAGTGENRPYHGGRGGTMALRLVGSGLDVRAKTGTLPGVSSLAGYVTAQSGRVLTFALMMQGPETAPILEMRAVQDRLVRQMAAEF